MPKISYHHIETIVKKYGIPVDLKTTRVELFKQAMTHHSVSDKNYDRLEYLGDSVYHLIVSEYLFHRYTDEEEGFLTKLRIRLERSDAMVELSQILGLDTHLQISCQIEDSHYEDIFEAFVAAFYLNYGIVNTRQLLLKLIERYKDLADLIYHDDNYKDLLMRYFHSQGWGEPIYKKSEDNMLVLHGRTVLGSSKLCENAREAEQLASKNALEQLNVLTVKKTSKTTDKGPCDIYNEKNKLYNITGIKQVYAKYDVKITQKFSAQEIKLFTEAMTHSSYIQRKARTEGDKLRAKTSVSLQKRSNSRLTFLGSAVYHFITAEHLFHQYSKEDESFLTKMRACLEHKKVKYRLSALSGIREYVLVSHGIESAYGRTNLNIFGKAFTAFVGASYLTFGFHIVQRYLLEIIRQEIDMAKIVDAETDYKMLIKGLAKDWPSQPQYNVTEIDGPDHCRRYTVGLFCGSELLARGRSGTKKKAAQLAAKRYYKKTLEK